MRLTTRGLVLALRQQLYHVLALQEARTSAEALEVGHLTSGVARTLPFFGGGVFPNGAFSHSACWLYYCLQPARAMSASWVYFSGAEGSECRTSPAKPPNRRPVSPPIFWRFNSTSTSRLNQFT